MVLEVHRWMKRPIKKKNIKRKKKKQILAHDSSQSLTSPSEFIFLNEENSLNGKSLSSD
jgi:hypothetical protein